MVCADAGGFTQYYFLIMQMRWNVLTALSNLKTAILGLLGIISKIRTFNLNYQSLIQLTVNQIKPK